MYDDTEANNSLDNISDLMNRSEYDKVIFHDVADSYATDNDIECQYTLTPSVIPAEGDKVALFKVGWESPNLYLKYQLVKIPEDKEHNTELSVIFKAEDLPKDDEVFYQFCYVCADGVVRGASIPFRFRHPATEELIEIEDTESDLLIIRTRTAVIEERLREVAFKNNELARSKADLELRLKNKNEQYEELMKKITDCQYERETLKEEAQVAAKNYNETIEKLQNELQEEMNKAAGAAASFMSQTIQNDAYIQELRSTIKLLSEEKEIRDSKIISGQKEIDILQKRLLAEETSYQKLMEKHEQLKKELAKTVTVTQNQNQTLINQEYESQRKTRELKQKIAVIEDEKKRFMNQLIDTEHMLAAMEKSKHLATDELMKHADYKKKMTEELYQAQNHISSMENQMKALHEEKNQLIIEKDQLQKEYNAIQEKYSTLQKNFEALVETKQNLENDKEGYNLLVSNLTERLKAGAAEYQTKYIECVKLEKKLGKIKKKLKEKISESRGDTSDCEAKNIEISSSSEDNYKAKEGAGSKAKLNSSIENLLTVKDLHIKFLEEKIENFSKETPSRNIPSQTPPAVADSQYPYPSAYSLHQAFANNLFPANPYMYQHIYYPPPSFVNKENSIEVKENHNHNSQPVNEEDGVLPPPIQPEITPLAKVAAVTAVSRNFDKQETPSPQMQAGYYPDSTSDCDGPADNSSLPDTTNYSDYPHERRVNSFICPFCGEHFYEYSLLHKHTETVHLGLECPICNKPFHPDEQMHFESHVQEHFEDETERYAYHLDFD